MLSAVSCAQTEHEIKISAMKENSKNAIWRTWSFREHLTKEFNRFRDYLTKRLDHERWFERDKANAFENETIKTNVKRLQWKQNQRNRFRRFEVEQSSFSCFYRVQMTWKIIIDYSSHALTKERDDVWIKQRNK